MPPLFHYSTTFSIHIQNITPTSHGIYKQQESIQLLNELWNDEMWETIIQYKTTVQQNSYTLYQVTFNCLSLNYVFYFQSRLFTNICKIGNDADTTSIIIPSIQVNQINSLYICRLLPTKYFRAVLLYPYIYAFRVYEPSSRTMQYQIEDILCQL